jgi:hypothetical protein
VQGLEPRWRADGRELFFMAYESPDLGHLMAVPVEPDGAGLRVGAPHKLFTTHIRFINATDNVFSYSPTRDGQRFLVAALTDEELPTVNVITDWEQTVAEPTGLTAR